VKDLTRFLDPSGLGVISFEDFHRGITAIGNGGSDPDLYKLQLTSGDANGAAEEYDEFIMYSEGHVTVVSVGVNNAELRSVFVPPGLDVINTV
ncbi:rab11 family-interacting protein 3 isoform X1, partial [Tachysurus ichikawai]